MFMLDLGMPQKTGWGFATSELWMRRPWFSRTRLVFFDLGGEARIRNIWRNYLAEIHACIYVIDASDTSRLKEAAEAFGTVFDDQRILANKQDLPNTASTDDIMKALGFLNLGDNVRIVPTCLLPTPHKKRNRPLQQGLTWLINSIKRSAPTLLQKVIQDTARQQEEWDRERAEKRERVERYRQEREQGLTSQPAAVGNGSDGEDKKGQGGERYRRDREQDQVVVKENRDSAEEVKSQPLPGSSGPVSTQKSTQQPNHSSTTPPPPLTTLMTPRPQPPHPNPPLITNKSDAPVSGSRESLKLCTIDPSPSSSSSSLGTGVLLSRPKLPRIQPLGVVEVGDSAVDVRDGGVEVKRGGGMVGRVDSLVV
ncbi:ADP-ribosylation factor-like protein 13B [Dinochytrium kinnereticum]|nr:ADP-ribosylation factor-like protein 13B [Dinochytrium kinnereticum]